MADMSTWRPGSEPEAAKEVEATGDFGVPEATPHRRERDYVSENTRRSDPGGAQPHAGEDDGRTAGVGGDDSGPGSSSAGDVDPQMVGVGSGGSSVSISGRIHEKPGPDAAQTFSHEVGKGAHGEGTPDPTGGRLDLGAIRPPEEDITIGAAAQGADAANNPAAELDDAFAGEVSSDEASGTNDVG